MTTQTAFTLADFATEREALLLELQRQAHAYSILARRVGAHFASIDDQLLASTGDADAAYTAEVYDVNDVRKLEYRKRRRETIELALQVWCAGVPENSVSDVLGDDESVSLSRRIHAARILAYRQLQRYAVVPRDAAIRCICATADLLETPSWLLEQAVEVDISGT